MLAVEKLKRFASKSRPQRREAVRATLRSAAPRCGAVARLAWLYILGDRGRRRETFRHVYRAKMWGSDGDARFFSGPGSRGEAAELYAQRIAELLECHSTQLGRPITVIDIGCGDFQVGSALVSRLPTITYIGCDIVPELIAYNSKRFAAERVSFLQLDVVSGPLPKGDVCLVRQVLQHLSNGEIARVLARLDYQFIYVTEGQPTISVGPPNPDKLAGYDVRFDCRVGGGGGVELDQPPYNLNIEELFRVSAGLAETVVTTRILPASPEFGADRDGKRD